MFPAESKPLVDRLDAVLPQTQCTRCAEPDCRRYAEAIAEGRAPINRCPPGGAEGVARLAALTGQPLQPLDPAHGTEGPLHLAFIDEAWCIGCTLCIKACPVDAIVGTNKLMHTVVASQCTGCELCVPACPVDCITMAPASGELTGWQAWSERQAEQARERYAFHRVRTERDKREHDERLVAKAQAKLAALPELTLPAQPEAVERKRAVIEAALARARAQRASR